eukprot:4609604-Prymnesium_polylepis.3
MHPTIELLFSSIEPPITHIPPAVSYLIDVASQLLIELLLRVSKPSRTQIPPPRYCELWLHEL